LAILGLDVRHDLDIAPATRSVSGLSGNVCLTCLDDLLISYKVACQFEFTSLRHRVLGLSILDDVREIRACAPLNAQACSQKSRTLRLGAGAS